MECGSPSHRVMTCFEMVAGSAIAKVCGYKLWTPSLLLFFLDLKSDKLKVI